MDNFAFELKDRSRTDTLPATVENVKCSCTALADTPDCLVKINKKQAFLFAEELQVQDVRQSSHYMEIPTKFRKLNSEVCFHVTLHLFNFGHGFRHPLHTTCGRGAWQTMKRGVETLYSKTEKGFIDANTLIKLSEESINEFFHLPPQGSSSDAEKITPLRDMILRVAHSTGKRLLELGYPSFADFVSDHTSSSANGYPSALKLVEALADNFPAFDDRRELQEGKEVLFLKKAQIAVAELYQRLRTQAGQFDFWDVRNLTVACDNVLPCVLRSLGILKLDPELKSRIDEGKTLPAGVEEAQLRAAAIVATEIILEKANGAYWAKELGDYLWTLGKRPSFRKVERHATIDTCFY